MHGTNVKKERERKREKEREKVRERKREKERKKNRERKKERKKCSLLLAHKHSPQKHYRLTTALLCFTHECNSCDSRSATHYCLLFRNLIFLKYSVNKGNQLQCETVKSLQKI